MTRTPRGHRLLPHTADCIIEAWGPDRAACVSEALEALVEEFAEIEDPPSTRLLPLSSGPGGAEEVLVSVLEEVIYTLDVFSVIPVRFHLCDTAGGGVSGDMEVIPVSEARIV